MYANGVGRLVSFIVAAAFMTGHVLNESTTVQENSIANNTVGNLSSDREVCELNNTCTTHSNSSVPVAKPVEKKVMPERWQYNVSEKKGDNETTDTMHSIHEPNSSTDALSFEIDISQVAFSNQSTSPNETKPVTIKYPIQLEKDCFCDITKGGCDLNCCCDPDCRYVNRNVFQTCNKSFIKPNEDSTCITRVLDSPLLCIVKDNLYSRHFYPYYKASKEIAQVDKLMKNRQVFGWPTISPPPDDRTNEVDVLTDGVHREYEVGSPLLIATEHGLKTFRLPRSTSTSRDCSHLEAVVFLTNFETVCTHRLSRDLVAECEGENSIFNANSYFRNISIVTNPGLVNDSYKLDCVRNCVNITPLVCDSEDRSTCETRNVSSLIPHLSTDGRNVCARAVTNVQYVLSHNGTDGVLTARVFLLLQDLAFEANALWAVKFATRYAWIEQNDTFEVSGYPGYVTGKPVITGFRVPIDGLNLNVTRYTINMDRRRERWLTTFSTDGDGSCSTVRRRNILFEHNVFAQCSIRRPQIQTAQQCEQLQMKVFKVMFGDYVNLTNVLISAYGAPDTREPSTWVPLVTDLDVSVESANGTCSELVTSVKLVILHSVVGDYDKPEQTIVAAKLSGTRFNHNLSNHDRLRITFAANFYDITNPPLRVFAEPPTYEIKLPTDFFYPFFSAARRLVVVDCRMWFLLSLAVVLQSNSVYYRIFIINVQ